MTLRIATLFGRIVAVGALLGSALSVAAGCNSEGGGPNELVGTTWRWQRTLINNDTAVAPDDPSRYTLTGHGVYA